MAILAGETVSAAKLNRLQPKTYLATSSADLTGAVTDTDITDATVTFTTETDGARFDAAAFADFDTTGGGTTTIGTVQLVVDGVAQSGQITSQFGAATANDRGTPGQMWDGTLPTAGSHTIKLQATLPANMQVRSVHTKLRVVVTEVV